MHIERSLLPQISKGLKIVDEGGNDLPFGLKYIVWQREMIERERMKWNKNEERSTNLSSGFVLELVHKTMFDRLREKYSRILEER